MLSIKKIEELKKLGIIIEGTKVTMMGVDLVALNAAIADEKEVDFNAELKSPEGITILDDDGLELVKTNVKKGHETAFSEILAKELAKEYGITIDKKDPREAVKLIAAASALKAVEEAKLTPDEQVKEKDKIIEQLRKSITDGDGEKETFKTQAEQYRNELNSVREMNEWSKFLPEDHNPLLGAEDYRRRIKEEKGIDFKKINGVWVTTDLEGNPIKDKLVKDIPAKDKIKEIFDTTPQWKKVVAAESSGGGLGTGSSTSGGGSTATGGSYKNMSELRAAKEANKWSQKEFKDNYTKAVAENPDFGK
jgi:hypothetical protein